MWDPQQYALFQDHRARPFADLLARVDATRPRLVVDLGCGDGTLTTTLARRWPGARVVGVDSSPQMLATARAHDTDGSVTWVDARAQDWDPAALGAPVDVLLSNALLQWVPGHLDLLPRWVEALAAGGSIALQVPGNLDAPSHRLMREAAARQPRAAALATRLDRSAAAVGPATYLTALTRLGLAADVWETTYLHVLPARRGARHPVLEWVRGTGLRPALDVLDDPDELEVFLDDYEAELERAYPRGPAGVVLPFRRVFAVGRLTTPARPESEVDGARPSGG